MSDLIDPAALKKIAASPVAGNSVGIFQTLAEQAERFQADKLEMAAAFVDAEDDRGKYVAEFVLRVRLRVEKGDE